MTLRPCARVQSNSDSSSSISMRPSGSAAQTVIMGMADILLVKSTPNGSEQERLQAIVEAGHRITEILLKMKEIRRVATTPYIEDADIVDLAASSREESPKEDPQAPSMLLCPPKSNLPISTSSFVCFSSSLTFDRTASVPPPAFQSAFSSPYSRPRAP